MRYIKIYMNRSPISTEEIDSLVALAIHYRSVSELRDPARSLGKAEIKQAQWQRLGDNAFSH